MRANLTALIVEVLGYSLDGASYYQGFHDLAAIVLLKFRSNFDASRKVLWIMSNFYLKYPFVPFTFECEARDFFAANQICFLKTVLTANYGFFDNF